MVARRGRKILRGLRRLHDRRRVAAFSHEFQIGAFEHGVIGAASLFGILIGAVTLGGLSDRFGRKPMFVAEMIIFVAFLVALCFATNYIQVAIFLFGLGLALGCDYPTAHMIISENIPSSKRGRLVLGAFAFQAVGALAGTAVGFFVLSVLPQLSAWRWMYASAIIPAVLVTLGRFYIVESANWLSARGEIDGRSGRRKGSWCASRNILRRSSSLRQTAKRAAETGHSFAALFNSENRRATILASVPWFLQDLGTYGIGIFTPTILAAAVGGQRKRRACSRRPASELRERWLRPDRAGRLQRREVEPHSRAHRRGHGGAQKVVALGARGLGPIHRIDERAHVLG